jgi:hypothetical protein
MPASIPTRTKGPRAVPTQPIRADEAYDLKEFLERVGWKRSALTAARADGLKVAEAGRRCYVRGAAWLEYLESRECQP